MQIGILANIIAFYNVPKAPVEPNTPIRNPELPDPYRQMPEPLNP